MQIKTKYGTIGGWIQWGTGQPSAGWNALWITPALYMSLYRCWKGIPRQVLIELKWLRWDSQLWWHSKKTQYEHDSADK